MRSKFLPVRSRRGHRGDTPRPREQPLPGRLAAARGTAVPATLSRLRPADWEAALDAKFGETLNAAALRNLASAAGSEALCDHLLRYAVPRLLKEHAAKTPDAAPGGGVAALVRAAAPHLVSLEARRTRPS